MLPITEQRRISRLMAPSKPLSCPEMRTAAWIFRVITAPPLAGGGAARTPLPAAAVVIGRSSAADAALISGNAIRKDSLFSDGLGQRPFSAAAVETTTP